MGRKSLQLEILPVAQLLPHEEISRALLRGLTSKMLQDGIQKDPIIVDRASMVVLDGMHRLHALKQLGADRAACNLVDYMDDGVRLMRWTRCVPSPGTALVSKVLKGLKMRERVSVPGALKLLDSRMAGLALVLNGVAFLSAEEGHEGATKESVRKFDSIVEKEEASMTFVDEQSLPRELRSRDKALLLAGKLEKEEVTEAAKKVELFPHKTTMHILELRPVGLNIPLSRLRGGARAEDLARALEGRARRIIEPPAEYMGRTYNDRLVVLS